MFLDTVCQFIFLGFFMYKGSEMKLNLKHFNKRVANFEKFQVVAGNLNISDNFDSKK